MIFPCSRHAGHARHMLFIGIPVWPFLRLNTVENTSGIGTHIFNFTFVKNYYIILAGTFIGIFTSESKDLQLDFWGFRT